MDLQGPGIYQLLQQVMCLKLHTDSHICSRQGKYIVSSNNFTILSLPAMFSPLVTALTTFISKEPVNLLQQVFVRAFHCFLWPYHQASHVQWQPERDDKFENTLR